ncbi:MAG: hypothetical protein V2A73_16860 [Pseudomonadota bacterium]
MLSLSSPKMFRLATALVLVAQAGCSRGCGCACRPKPQPAKPAVEKPSGPIAPKTLPGEEQPEPIFRRPTGKGLRRFAAPKGGEVLSLAAAPAGDQLVAATGAWAFVFDSELGKAKSFKLPGLYAAPVALSLAPPRAAVLVRIPTDWPAGSLFLFDAAEEKLLKDIDLPGVPVFGASMAGDRLAVVLSEPPSILLFDRDGAMLAKSPLPDKPVRMQSAVEGTWAAVVTASGVVIIDAGSAGEPSLTPLGIGPGRLSPSHALPLRDQVLVVGSADGGKPFAVVASRRQQGAQHRLAIGSGEVLGAALGADRSRALVFTRQRAKDTMVALTYLFDTTSWAPAGMIDTGPVLPSSRSVSVGNEVLVPVCRKVASLNLATASWSEQYEVPGPETAPCLDGIVRVGKTLVARDGPQIAAWSIDSKGLTNP